MTLQRFATWRTVVAASVGVVGWAPAVASADVLENITVAALALSHDGVPTPLAWPAAVFTLVKTLLAVATLAATCIGATRRLWARMRPSR